MDCVFRSAPFNYIDVGSDGKCIHTMKSLMQQVELLCKHLFQNVFKPTASNPLALSDFLSAKKKETEIKAKAKR